MTALNDPGAVAYSRAPLLRVLTNGKAIPGALEASVTGNSHYQADRFSAVFAINADPAYSMAWWLAQSPPMVVDVQIGLNGAWQSIHVGEVDSLRLSPDGAKVEIEGRDLTGRLIEAKTQESFQNLTSSEIAVTLAGRHGLTADVHKTTTLASRYWAADFTRETAGQFSRVTTEWDLLCSLARNEGYDVWVDGTTLHFQPAVSPSSIPYVVRYAPRVGASPPASNAIDLRMEKAFTLARDVEVTVKSWHSKQGRSFSKVAKASGVKNATASPAKGSVSTQRYVFIRPNLTEAQAQKLANSLLADISKHERVIQWREPGNLILTPRNLVRLDGTGTDFDQTYYVDTITRTISQGGGFAMSVRAKNHNTTSQAVV